MERNTGKELYGELQLSTCHQSNHGTGREQSAVESEGKAEVVVGILGRLMERLFELNLRVCARLFFFLILSVCICVLYIRVLEDVCACVRWQMES